MPDTHHTLACLCCKIVLFLFYIYGEDFSLRDVILSYTPDTATGNFLPLQLHENRVSVFPSGPPQH